jgi:hypothetical protein
LKSLVEVNVSGAPRWARIVAITPEKGSIVTVDFEIHYAYAPSPGSNEEVA